MKRKYDFMTLAVSCAVCVGVTILVGAGILVWQMGGLDGMSGAMKFAKLLNLAETNYVGEFDTDSAVESAYKAMISSGGDKWSYYMTAEEYESYVMSSENTYTGVGISIQSDEESGGLRITKVVENSPAQEAGLVVGDIIMYINDRAVDLMTTSEAREIIQSATDAVSFAVIHEDGSDSVFDVACREIYSDPVSYELLGDDVGYIKIANFEGGSSDGAIAAIEDLIQMGATSLVFDVRNNPGGKLSELMTLLDRILPEGDIFVSISKDGKTSTQTSDSECVELPMAVLVNASSYSAAEYFAAILSEFGVAEVVGEHTTGKGRSQTNVLLSDGSALHISSKAYSTPNGTDLSETGGLEPDVTVELDAQKEGMLYAGILDFDQDDQLIAAAEMVKLEKSA